MASTMPKPAIHPSTVSVSVSVAATANAANGGVHVDSVSAGAKIRLGAAPALKYTCVIETKKHRKLVGYKPLTVHNGGRSHSMTWLLSPYSVKRARFLASGPTFQVEMCLVGAGHSWNFWHQWFDGGAIVLRYTKPHMIGNKWGTEVVKGGASATLSFQLSKGAASIGGSTQVKNYGTHDGDTGEDPNLNVPKKWRKFNINRVNAFYISSHDFFYQGTGSNEGNVGHALYEFDTASTVNFQYGAAIQVRAFCAEACARQGSETGRRPGDADAGRRPAAVRSHRGGRLRRTSCGGVLAGRRGGAPGCAAGATCGCGCGAGYRHAVPAAG